MRGRWLIDKEKLCTDISTVITTIGSNKIDVKFEMIDGDETDYASYISNEIILSTTLPNKNRLVYNIKFDGATDFQLIGVYNFTTGKWSSGFEYADLIDIKNYNSKNKEFLYKFLTNYATKASDLRGQWLIDSSKFTTKQDTIDTVGDSSIITNFTITDTSETPVTTECLRINFGSTETRDYIGYIDKETHQAIIVYNFTTSSWYEQYLYAKKINITDYLDVTYKKLYNFLNAYASRVEPR